MAEQAGAQTGEDRAQSPWPMRIVAIITVVSIAAIALGIFLPREQEEFKPVAGQEVAETSAQNAQAPQWQQWQTQQPQQQAESQTMAPDSMQQQQAQPQPQQQQQPQQFPQQQQQAQQFPQQQVQQQSQQQQPQTQTWSGRSSASAPVPQTSTGQPATSGAAASPNASQPGTQRAQQAAPQASPAQGQGTASPQPGPQAGPLFTPQQAQGLIGQAEAMERGERWGALSFLVNMLRQKEYQDPDNWPLLQAAMATSGVSMVPGGIESGHGEIFAAISNSRNGAEAANRLERMGHEPTISPSVQRQCVQVLATARDYNGAVSGVKRVLASNKTELSAKTMQHLDQAIARAWQNRETLRRQHGR